MEFVDSGYVGAGGQNSDFHFLGDGVFDPEVGLAFERDAVRFSSTACGLPYICRIDSPPQVVDAPDPAPANGIPVSVAVAVSNTFDGSTTKIGGLSVLWQVESGGCQLVCDDPCYTFAHMDLVPPFDPNTGEARVDLFSNDPGDCTVKFSVVAASDPPVGPAGSVDCENIDAQGEIVINFSE